MIQKKYRINKLNSKSFQKHEIQCIWKPEEEFKNNLMNFDVSRIKIFGKDIRLIDVNWNKDYISNYEYTYDRIDKIKVHSFFNKGNDIKFPWELSRFYFAPQIACMFQKTGDRYYFDLFKRLIFDWDENNEFLFGINWTSTMEVSIRAINIIIAINLLEDKISDDSEFNEFISILLLKHTEYIHNFLEIYEGGHTTNHTVSNYLALLFLGLTIRSHPHSDKWIDDGIEGLNHCIKYQTYNDGVNFEGSTSYHKLVTEMFAWGAVISLQNKIKLTDAYVQNLFKMFEYTAAYLNRRGTAPQVGDNDSGRLIKFYNNEDSDHCFLLKLGNSIFNYKFKTYNNTADSCYNYILSKEFSLEINNYNISPRETNKSIAFNDGGASILKNNSIHLFISNFPIGQNGQGGHNHIDSGSFTFEAGSDQIIVDPGTYSYTRDLNLRKELKSIYYHNTIITPEDELINLRAEMIWKLENIFESKIIELDENNCYLGIRNALSESNKVRSRKFQLSENEVIIYDAYPGSFASYFHLNPAIVFNEISKSKIGAANFSIEADNCKKIVLEDYIYSQSYDSKINSKRIIIKAENELTTTIRIWK